MTHWRQIASLVASVLVLSLGACGTVSTPTSAVSPTAATSQPAASPSPTTPAGASAVIRATVTGAHPVLLPTAIPAGWSALIVTVNASVFDVIYASLDGAKSVSFAIVVANPPPQGPHGSQSTPNFHGDMHSLYQVDDTNQATSKRWLMWTEPGTWSGPNGTAGVPYFMDGNGLTDAEFWSIVNSAHA